LYLISNPVSKVNLLTILCVLYYSFTKFSEKAFHTIGVPKTFSSTRLMKGGLAENKEIKCHSLPRSNYERKERK
jgi:hypothetical protein